MAYVGTPKRLETDVETIATILTGEAGGEPIQEIIAVACVMLNRADHDFCRFGMTMVDQATAHMQFQGQTIPPSPVCLHIAEEALSGELHDITQGAIYYANPRTSSARWARRLNSTNSLRIGRQYFTDNVVGIPFPRRHG